MNTTAVRSRRRIAILSCLLLVVAILATIPGIARPQAAYATSTAAYAGNGTQGYTTGSGAATGYELNYPSALATEGGNLFIADTYNELVREVGPGGDSISNFYGTPQTAELVANDGLWHPSGVAVDGSGNVYISDTLNCVVWVVNSSGGDPTIAAGSSSGCGSTSGKLDEPAGITFDTSTGTLFIADQYNCEIKAIGGSYGSLTVVAGNGTCGYSTGSGVATSAELNYPNSVAVANGELYIADTSNSRIRVVNLASGDISNFAGTGSASNSGNGGPATSAGVQTPAAVAADPAGDVFIGTGSGSVRWVNHSGTINYIAGFSGSITALAVDVGGDIYAGTTGFQVYKITGFWTPSGSTGLEVLGDSYSSGEGVPDFTSDSASDGCDRSEAGAYADVLNASGGLTLNLFVACSGATSADMYSTYNTETSQVAKISTSDNYVVLTVGGDDIGFPAFVQDCVGLDGCASGSTAYDNAEYAIDYVLPSELASLFGRIASQIGSSTRVLVLGYPQEIAAAGAPWYCSGTLDSESQAGAVQVESDLNTAISAAVSAADTGGKPFEYVNPWDQFSGHQYCSSDPYFNGIEEENPAWSFHPNAQGQEAYAQAVEDYLANHPTAP